MWRHVMQQSLITAFLILTHLSRLEKTANFDKIGWNYYYTINIKERQISILTAITLTNVVLPEYCKPTSVNSISSLQNKLFIQSKILLKNDNILQSSCERIVLPSCSIPQTRHMTKENMANDGPDCIARQKKMKEIWLRGAFHSFFRGNSKWGWGGKLLCFERLFPS